MCAKTANPKQQGLKLHKRRRLWARPLWPKRLIQNNKDWNSGNFSCSFLEINMPKRLIQNNKDWNLSIAHFKTSANSAKTANPKQQGLKLISKRRLVIGFQFAKTANPKQQGLKLHCLFSEKAQPGEPKRLIQNNKDWNSRIHGAGWHVNGQNG